MSQSDIGSSACAFPSGQQRVGYKSPPRHTQFQKSGNPGGRPKKPAALDFDKLVIKFVEGRLPHSDKTFFDVLLGALAKQVAQGEIRATKYLIELYLHAKRRKRQSSDASEVDRQAAARVLASISSFDLEALSGSGAVAPDDDVQSDE